MGLKLVTMSFFLLTYLIFYEIKVLAGPNMVKSILLDKKNREGAAAALTRRRLDQILSYIIKLYVCPYCFCNILEIYLVCCSKSLYGLNH